MKISIVLAARNDNYGGDFLLRLQRSVDSIVYGVEAAELAAEIVIVEWNPPDDRPPLEMALRLPEKTQFLSVRIITVPKEQHEKFGVKIPLIEYTAKNTGLRRAEGDFILVTNPDIFFPESLFKMIAGEKLDETAFYRADRIDVTPPGKEFEELPHGEKEAWFSANAVHAHILSGSFPLTHGEAVPATINTAGTVSAPMVSEKDMYTNASGDFLLASAGAWNAIGGFKETTEYFTAIDSFCCLQMLSLGLRQRVFPASCQIWHFDHSRDSGRLNRDPAYKDYFFYRDKLFSKVSIIPINNESWGLVHAELPAKTLLAPRRGHRTRTEKSRELLFRQTLTLLRQVTKNPPFEPKKKSGTLFLYDSSLCLRDGCPPQNGALYYLQENTPGPAAKTWLPSNGQSHIYTPFFPVPDCSGGVETLTITLRFSSGSVDAAKDYRCLIQYTDYSTLNEFTCSVAEPEQVYKVQLAYQPEQLLRLVLLPLGTEKLYSTVEYIRVDTDCYSLVVDFYHNLENIKIETIISSATQSIVPPGGLMKQPYLSIVTVSRNDEHGGDPQRRTQIFIDSYAWQAERYKLETELILIDWNPPKEKPGLADILNFPANEYFSVRVITVPPQVHEGFRYNEILPLFQFIGKNAGIRRARGEFILTTCMDSIMDDRLFEYIARKKLDKDCVYRADLYDVKNTLPDAGHTGQQEFCHNPENEGIVRVKNQYFRTLWEADRSHGKSIEECGENFPWRDFFDDEGSILGKLRIRDIQKINSEANGDFTLMHKEAWYALRGYGEFESYSMHIDSQLLAHAVFYGFTEVSFVPPLVCYHIEHGFHRKLESNFTTIQEHLKKMVKSNIPVFAWSRYDPLGIASMERITNLLQQYPRTLLNTKRWGLRDINLEEYIFDSDGRTYKESKPIPWDFKLLSAVKPEYYFEKIAFDSFNDTILLKDSQINERDSLINEQKTIIEELKIPSKADRVVKRLRRHRIIWFFIRNAYRAAVKLYKALKAIKFFVRKGGCGQ